MKPIIVQKYGGTSLGNPERLRSLVGIVKRDIIDFQPILVVSAISGTTKSEGSTNLLLRASQNAVNGLAFELELDSLRKQHLNVIKELIGTTDSLITNVIDEELGALREFLLAVTKIREVSSRSIDRIISIGEKLSANLISRILQLNGLNAIPCDLSEIFIESEIDKSEVREIDKLYNRCTEKFRDTINKILIENSEDGIPVVSGFFGRLPGGILEVIGRGYSDLTAALIAKSFSNTNVKELQVWKEVDGVYTADPRKVENAKVLDYISPIEAAELTFFGSEVIHPYTMEQVTSVGIPIRVLNSLKPEDSGTLIKDIHNLRAAEPTAITAKSDISVLSITSNRMYDAKGFLMNLFSILDKYDLVVDLVSTSEITVSCTVNDNNKLKAALSELELLGDVEIIEKRAILALVGRGLQKQSFSASHMLKVLADEGIPVEMITQATTQMSISCVIEESLVYKALNVVHDSFFKK